jgi:glutamate/tyrosine decarboxylase-like PLP-dependent enzyme
MDTGFQLGRRFRALKLWMLLRDFGVDGIRAVLAEHIRLARLFAGWVDADEEFERLAPVPFSAVCFRAAPRSLTGDEPVDVLEYHSSHADFPHESTANQFFDEAQWESYRRLGEHIGSQVLTTAIFDLANHGPSVEVQSAVAVAEASAQFRL